MINYGVNASPGRVEAWSSVRLPFEPKGWLLDYRRDLREALQSAEPADGALLYAEYATPDHDFADLENVLLYNVGSRSYSHLARNGLVCSRAQSHDENHRVVYELSHREPPLPSDMIATARLDSAPNSEKAGQWWAAFRSALSTDASDPHVGAYTIAVTLGEGWRNLGWISKVKPMLDGLVSALHVHDGTERDHMTRALGNYGDGEQLWATLNDRSLARLGERRLVRPHGAGMAWNPADELCSMFSVTFDERLASNAMHAAVARVDAG